MRMQISALKPGDMVEFILGGQEPGTYIFSEHCIFVLLLPAGTTNWTCDVVLVQDDDGRLSTSPASWWRSLDKPCRCTACTDPHRKAIQAAYAPQNVRTA